MTITAIRTDIFPGAIVHVRQFPFFDKNESKSRYAFVVKTQGNTVTLRGIYTNNYRGRVQILKTRANRLHHNSYLDSRTVTRPISKISRYVGETPYDYDPFNDFVPQTKAS